MEIVAFMTFEQLVYNPCWPDGWLKLTASYFTPIWQQSWLQGHPLVQRTHRNHRHCSLHLPKLSRLDKYQSGRPAKLTSLSTDQTWRSLTL